MKSIGLISFAIIAMVLLLSCSKKEDLDPNLDDKDQQTEAERIMLESFTHGEFFATMKKYAEVDCEAICINATPASWVLQESIHRFNAQFFIDLKIYNTPTDIIYAFQIKSSNNSRPFIRSINGEAINAPAYELKVPKESSWNSCDAIEERFTVSRGAGQPILIDTSYKLFGTCD